MNPRGESGIREVLYDAAFGHSPQLWPLPAATDELVSWYRSVALGGQGRYAAARAELSRYHPRSVELASLHESTRASWLRQLGRHERARRYDAAAMRSIGLGGTAASAGTVEARCDALVGLAADALGLGRFGLADRLLGRSADELSGRAEPQLWRPALRAGWVAAELAMMRGDGTAAVRHARAARAIADGAESIRHTVKSDLVLAAASSCAGETSAAHEEAARIAGAAAASGLLPLQWAATMLSEGTGGVDAAVDSSARLAAVISERGGVPHH